jgi:hypothetical protein
VDQKRGKETPQPVEKHGMNIQESVSALGVLCSRTDKILKQLMEAAL